MVTRHGPRKVLASHPAAEIVVGGDELTRLRETTAPSALDREIVARAEAGSFDVYAFAARHEASAWRLADDLRGPELLELGTYLVQSHLWVYRRLAAAGVACIIAVELGEKEHEAMARGTRHALELVGDTADPQHDLDRWLLQHMCFFTSVAMSRAVGHILPDKLPLLERRRPSLAKLLVAAGFTCRPRAADSP